MNGMSTSVRIDYDAIVIGAGFAGMYAIHKLRQQGFTVHAFEVGSGVGGTWYWNRYPGARCDVESLAYQYTFDRELIEQWTWTERFATQPEILAYSEWVADKFDLRMDITFNVRVDSAVFDEDSTTWVVLTSDGRQTRARYCITAVGCLSDASTPPFPGLDTFVGEVYHTGAWPHEGVDFTGKRVAVIGTGSSGVQAIPEIAETSCTSNRVPTHAQLHSAGTKPEAVPRREHLPPEELRAVPERARQCPAGQGATLAPARGLGGERQGLRDILDRYLEPRREHLPSRIQTS